MESEASRSSSSHEVLCEERTAGDAAAIEFNIPPTDPGFVDVDSHLAGGDPEPDAFLIQPQTALPALDNPTWGITLDGGSQTRFGGDTNPFGPEINISRPGGWVFESNPRGGCEIWQGALSFDDQPEPVPPARPAPRRPTHSPSARSAAGRPRRRDRPGSPRWSKAPRCASC